MPQDKKPTEPGATPEGAEKPEFSPDLLQAAEPETKSEGEAAKPEGPTDEPRMPVAGSAPATPPRPKRTFKQKLRALLRSKKFWLSLVGLLLATAIALWFIQSTRWWLMNIFGARNTVEVTAMTPADGKVKAAQLRNVTVTVNGKQYKTDAKGKVRVAGLPYGHVTISAKKTGYQDATSGVVLDFDPFLHKFGGQDEDAAARNVQLSMKSTGIPLSFKAVDFLSGKPVTTGDFTVADVVAKPDAQGLVSLRVPGTDDTKVSVSTSFGGAYVDKKFDVALGSSDVPQLTFVPGGKHYFVSKRSGVQSVYSSNLDGSDVQTIITGTGQETDATAFAVSPDGKYGVLSSTRDGARDSKKGLVQRIYVVDLGSKQLTRVDEASYMYFADWSGNTLVYQSTSLDASSGKYVDALRSVDASNKRVSTFESGGSFSVSTVAFDKVVYLKYIYEGPDSELSPILRIANANGTGIKTLGNKVSYDGYMQLDFDRVAFKTDQDQAWHEQNLNTNQLKSISQPANSNPTQQFLASANSDGNKRLVIDRIDGKYALIMKDTSTGETKQLYSAGGLGGPIRWIGDVIVYRVVTNQETADYAISIHGGDPKKIADVTATPSTQGSVVDQRFRFY